MPAYITTKQSVRRRKTPKCHKSQKVTKQTKTMIWIQHLLWSAINHLIYVYLCIRAKTLERLIFFSMKIQYLGRTFKIGKMRDCRIFLVPDDGTIYTNKNSETDLRYFIVQGDRHLNENIELIFIFSFQSTFDIRVYTINRHNDTTLLCHPYDLAL